MNGKDILYGFHYVNESLIDEAEHKIIKHIRLRFAIPIVASVAILIMATSLWSMQQSSLPLTPGNQIPPFVEDGNSHLNKQYTLYYNVADGQKRLDIGIEGHFWETLSALQMEKVLPTLAEKHRTDATVHYSYKDGKASLFQIDSTLNVNGKTVKITMAPDQVIQCYVIKGQAILSEIEGVRIEAGLFTTEKNSRGEQNSIYYASFRIDDMAYYVEYTGEDNDKAFFTNIVAEIVLGGKADVSGLENPSVPELREERLTEAQAYAESDFGAYLPKVPSGYRLNEARRFVNQTSDYLSASWSQGYQDIRIMISEVTEQDKQRLVSPQDTSLYDMSLYPIPWADSMPSDTREIIENPIIKREDLTVDILKMRGYIRGEANDPSGDSINIRCSVLYGDVLVDISTEGVSPSALFDALANLPRS